MRHENQTKGIAATSRPPAQDTGRHTPRAAAAHLSPVEITKRDAAMVDEDAAALARVFDAVVAKRPLEPPRRKAKP